MIKSKNKKRGIVVLDGIPRIIFLGSKITVYGVGIVILSTISLGSSIIETITNK